MPVPLLSVADLRRPPLGPVSLELAAGHCLAVSGPSGAGKSLLLRAVADLDPNTGTVRLNGRDRDALSAPEWRRRVVYVPAESGWWGETVADHLQARSAADPAALLRDVGLPEAPYWPVSRLSSGEKARLALVRALALAPAVLLLDEPTANLDPEATRAVEGLLQAFLAAGGGIMIATHDAAQRDRLADDRLHLSGGRQEAAR